MPVLPKVGIMTPSTGDLESAANIIKQRLNADSTRVPELDNALVSPGTVSASAGYSEPPSDAWLPFILRKTIQVPPSLLQEIKDVPRTCGMGLFPEIHCAYVTMNNQFYLWDYVEGIGFLRYEEQPYEIGSVALVKPKPGVFIDSIHWVVVLATKSSVALVGLARDGDDIRLFATEMTLMLDSNEMDNIVGTDDGRIFMTGTEDGNMYELNYQVQEGWFSKKIWLENKTSGSYLNLMPSLFNSKHQDAIVSLAVDSQRSYLYSYTRDSASLSVYSLGTTSTPSFDLVWKIESLPSSISSLIPGNLAQQFSNKDTFSLVSLHVIPKAESRSLCLLAVSFQGLRIYFSDSSTYPTYGYQPAGGVGGTRRLRIAHVRLPPSSARDQHSNIISSNAGDVVASSYSNGTFLYAYSSDAGMATDTNPVIGLAVDLPKLINDFSAAPSSQMVNTGYGMHQQQSQQQQQLSYNQQLQQLQEQQFFYQQQQQQGGMMMPGQGGPAPYPGPIQRGPVLNEYPESFVVPGRAWSIRHLIKSPVIPSHRTGVRSSQPYYANQAQYYGNNINASGASLGNLTTLNTLATQFIEPPEQFLVLSNMSLSFFVRKRSTDLLRAILESEAGVGAPISMMVQPTSANQNAQSPPGGLQGFIEQYGRDETCSELLALAAGNSFLTPDAWEPHAYGGVNANALGGLGGSNFDARLSHLAAVAFFERGERPVWTDKGTARDGQRQVSFSGRFEGLAIYLGRLLRPIWGEKVTQTSSSGRQDPFISEQTLGSVHKNLKRLEEFLLSNQHSFRFSAGDYALNRPSMDQEAWKQEATAMSQLEMLLQQATEAIDFVLLLTDYKLSEVVSGCDKPTQEAVSRLSYADLITTHQGRELAHSLLNSLINQQLSYQISLDAISEVLQQRCGSFCSADDVLQYKAMENLRRAKEAVNAKEKSTFMKEALRLFEKGILKMTVETLADITQEFRELKWAKGALELPLLCALAWDPENIASEYAPPAPSTLSKTSTGPDSSALVSTNALIINGFADHPAIIKRAWELRMRAYDIALDSLGSFGPPAGSAIDSDQGTFQAAFGISFGSSDPLFHSRLYDWCLDRGMTELLLSTETPFIEQHLGRHPIVRKRYDLLWQYLVNHGSPLKAAHICSELSETTELPLTFKERLQYLAVAASNGLSHSGTEYARKESAVEFLTDIEDRLEVGNLQAEILADVELLLKRHSPAEIDAIVEKPWGGSNKIAMTLLNVTELFNEYAEPLRLHARKLQIYQVSNYSNRAVVVKTWDDIISDVVKAHRSAGTQVESLAVQNEIIRLGNIFNSKATAFPLEEIAIKLEQYVLSHHGALEGGWAPRALVRGNVPPGDVFNVFSQIRQSQIPPFNTEENIQIVSADIAAFLLDWAKDASRPYSTARTDFPASELSYYVNQCLEEETNDRTKEIYNEIRSIILHHF